jgi:DNA-binding LacI/PurR family transcriptional regulator
MVSQVNKNQLRRHITMQDVAEQAQVSQSTVSRVLNESPSAIPISEETKHRVLAAIRTLGYRPNPFARALRGGSALLIGVIVRDIADIFFAQLISILSTMASANGYGLILGHAQTSSSEALALQNILDTRHCDGILMIGDIPGENVVFDELKKIGRPVVSLCRGQPPTGISAVNINNQKGALLLLEYLRDLGHHKIGFIDGGWVGDIGERRKTYHKFMKRNGWEHMSSCVLAEGNDPSGGYQAFKTLLSLPVRPTAIFASDDTLAIGALKVASEMGLRVPEQVSIAGFDDVDLAKFTIPALTTVRQPLDELAHNGLQLLLEMIEGSLSPDSGTVIQVEPQLIIRNSCGPPEPFHISMK